MSEAVERIRYQSMMVYRQPQANIGEILSRPILKQVLSRRKLFLFSRSCKSYCMYSCYRTICDFSHRGTDEKGGGWYRSRRFLIAIRWFLIAISWILFRITLPYRGVKYHLMGWERGNKRPQNKGELFNLRHSSLLNVIELILDVIKKIFPIWVPTPRYPFSFQCDLIKCTTWFY